MVHKTVHDIKIWEHCGWAGTEQCFFTGVLWISPCEMSYYTHLHTVSHRIYSLDVPSWAAGVSFDTWNFVAKQHDIELQVYLKLVEPGNRLLPFVLILRSPVWWAELNFSHQSSSWPLSWHTQNQQAQTTPSVGLPYITSLSLTYVSSTRCTLFVSGELILHVRVL